MKQAKEALSTPMTRKEFLRIVGTGMLTLLGITNFISLLSKTSQIAPAANKTAAQQTDKRSGFGSRKFGV